MPLLDAHYQHWDGAHVGIWARRWVIARHGMGSALRNRAMRNLVVVCWMAGLAMAAVLFLIGQLLVADSIVIQWVGQLNPSLQVFARLLTSWLQDHPEISVRTTQNLLFYLYCVYSMPLSIFALGLALPSLITRDLDSNAMVIYASKAVTRGDYLLGKYCSAFGLLTLTWLGPVCGAWLAGNLLSPDWRFFWHSRAALGHALLYGLSSMAILSGLALGVSAVSRREKSTPFIWWTWWVLGWVIQPIALHTKPWLRHLSFSYDLKQIGLASFRLGDDLKTARENIPMLGEMLRNIPPSTSYALDHPNWGGALVALVLMLVLAAWIISQRVSPE
jgi:hypothetical protein